MICPEARAINGSNEHKWKPGAGGGVGGWPTTGLGLLGPKLSPRESSGPRQGTWCEAPGCRNRRESRGHVQEQHEKAKVHSSCGWWGALGGGRKQNTFQGK